MNWNARKEELQIQWNEAKWNYRIIDFINSIITQEQSMIEKLEADKAELLHWLQIERDLYKATIEGFQERLDLYNQLIEKMEK